MKKLPLLLLTGVLSACSSATHLMPLTIQPTQAKAVLTVLPNPLITGFQDNFRVVNTEEMGVGLQMRRVDPAVAPRFRIRLPDGTYSAYWGGEQGVYLTEGGYGIGPLEPGTTFEVLMPDGIWVVFASYR